MPKRLLLVAMVMLVTPGSIAWAQKARLDASIRARSDASWEMARTIWNWAELGYKETRSSAMLAGALKAGGFSVETGVAGIPTSFVATIGSGAPVIAILGEYDALPGLSQEAVPERKSRAGASTGHG
ncbi:amidohydrolase, partial [Singulisphaera rosea]